MVVSALNHLDNIVAPVFCKNSNTTQQQAMYTGVISEYKTAVVFGGIVSRASSVDGCTCVTD